MKIYFFEIGNEIFYDGLTNSKSEIDNTTSTQTEQEEEDG